MACGIPQKCPDRYGALLRLRLILALLPPAAASVLLALRYGIPAALPPAALSALCVWAAACLPDAYLDSLSYSRHRDWLLVERGVFCRRAILIPRRQIQYVKLRRSPLERAFGLSSLVFVTSGGRTVLYGLDPADAERLRAFYERRSAR